MTPRNIHFSRIAEPDEVGGEADQESRRLRKMTNSPAREYAARPGAVEPLSDSVAALILCKAGRAKVERHQIKVKLDGDELFFTSSESIVIATKNGTDEKVLWVLNRRAPDVLHLLADDGSYIESVPRKGQAQWFSQDEASQDALRTAKTHMRRDMDRLQALHEPDSVAAIRDAQSNAAAVARLVQTFPAPASRAQDGETVCRESSPFPRADAFSRATEHVERSRGRREDLSRLAEEAMEASVTHSTFPDQPQLPDPYDLD